MLRAKNRIRVMLQLRLFETVARTLPDDRYWNMGDISLPRGQSTRILSNAVCLPHAVAVSCFHRLSMDREMHARVVLLYWRLGQDNRRNVVVFVHLQRSHERPPVSRAHELATFLLDCTFVSCCSIVAVSRGDLAFPPSQLKETSLFFHPPK